MGKKKESNAQRRRIHLTDHARQRMAERGITSDEVRTVVNEATHIEPDPRKPGVYRYEKHVATRRKIVVVAEEVGSSYEVISVWTG